MAVDFIPDPTIGTAIAQCLINKDCKMQEFVKDPANPLKDMSASFDIQFGNMIDVTVAIDELNTCLIAAVTAAIIAAGESVPTFDPTPSPPDFSGLTDDIEAMGGEIDTQLGYLDSIFTLEETSGVITRIQSP